MMIAIIDQRDKVYLEATDLAVAFGEAATDCNTESVSLPTATSLPITVWSVSHTSSEPTTSSRHVTPIPRVVLYKTSVGGMITAGAVVGIVVSGLILLAIFLLYRRHQHIIPRPVAYGVNPRSSMPPVAVSPASRNRLVLSIEFPTMPPAIIGKHGPSDKNPSNEIKDPVAPDGYCTLILAASLRYQPVSVAEDAHGGQLPPRYRELASAS
ncbi:hypothetical protein BKA62DRAFT_672405 [Auriculariales sp. MPI-PUGE-AT-0066]|nr:hypothetical protein BKA62DRAFT_672405 [Auriculariales sp. MPI-PUGE-AT-0066]